MTPITPPELRLVCTDFDGTIHSELDYPTIAHEFQDMIATLQRRGARWVINTGRELGDLFQEMKRSNLRVMPDYLVVVEREIYARRADSFERHAAWNDRCTSTHQRLFASMRTEVHRWSAWVREHFAAEVYEDPWSPFCLIATSPVEASDIVRQLEQWCRSWPELMVVSNHIYVRLSHVDFHKGSALREVASLCGAAPETTFIAGDHWNDLPMLKRECAHWLMAPDNAVPEVKSAVLKNGGWVEEGRASRAVTAGLRRCVDRQND